MPQDSVIVSETIVTPHISAPRYSVPDQKFLGAKNENLYIVIIAIYSLWLRFPR